MLYLFSCILGITAAIAADALLKTNVLRSPFFLKGLAIALFAQLVFDNFFVFRGLWVFPESALLGVRLPFLPLENLLFGIALWLITLVAWEYSAQRAKPSQSRV